MRNGGSAKRYCTIWETVRSWILKDSSPGPCHVMSKCHDGETGGRYRGWMTTHEDNSQKSKRREVNQTDGIPGRHFVRFVEVSLVE